jgi:hypothetical protein
MSEKLENWLDDHPGKTAADFADVSARLAAHGSLTRSEAYDSVKCGNRAGMDIMEFEAWEVIQKAIADGYLVRLGGGKYRCIKEPSPSVSQVRGDVQHDPERLPGEDDAAYWKRFWRLNRERIEELEREELERDQGKKKKRRPSGPVKAVPR